MLGAEPVDGGGANHVGRDFGVGVGPIARSRVCGWCRPDWESRWWGREREPPALSFLIPFPFLHLSLSLPNSHPLDPGPGARPQPIPCWPKQDLLPCWSPGPAGGGAGPESYRHHSVFPGSGTWLPGPQVRGARLCQVLWTKAGLTPANARGAGVLHAVGVGKPGPSRTCLAQPIAQDPSWWGDMSCRRLPG